MLHWLLDVYSLVVIASVVLSWMSLPEDHPVVRVVRQLTEPVFAPVRRVLPAIGGFDLSPLIVLLAIGLLQRLL
jgi:YggT family protein